MFLRKMYLKYAANIHNMYISIKTVAKAIVQENEKSQI